MLTLIEALNYRCLRHVKVAIRPFSIMVGPNASGKSTLIDVVSFLSDFVNSSEPLNAVTDRAPNFDDILWMNKGRLFEIVVEAKIPEAISKELEEPYEYCRYELSISKDPDTDDLSIDVETLWMKKRLEEIKRQRELFPSPLSSDSPIITTKKAVKGWKPIAKKASDTGNDLFYSHEKKGNKKPWDPVFKLGSKKSTLANHPDDEENFSVTTWFKTYISKKIYRIELNGAAMRHPSPPNEKKGFLLDGSNMPWVIKALKEKDDVSYREWLTHVRTALPDIVDVKTVVRDEDRHCYIKLIYESGLETPSWLVSDGTLRFLALTIMAYLPEREGIYLIEEPENGIHPQAIKAVYDSLSSIYNAQVIVATHSPIFLAAAAPEDILCFAKDETGATDIVDGPNHPRLKEWRKEQNLAAFFASGVLG